jgi:hypothetical protein
MNPLSILLTALGSDAWRPPYTPDQEPDGNTFQRWVVFGDTRGYLQIRREGDAFALALVPEKGDPTLIEAPQDVLAALFGRASGADSAPRRLFALVSRAHGNDAWDRINPMLASTLELAIRSRMRFEPDDAPYICKTYGGGHWLGPDYEEWYTRAIGAGNLSAATSITRCLRRDHFLLDGEYVHVGRDIRWQGQAYKVTSITAELVRAKRTEWDRTAGPTGNGYDEAGKCIMFPATLIEIPRAGFEAKIAADKAAAKAERAAEREAKRPDPVDLLPLDEHLLREVELHGKRERWGYNPPIDAEKQAWAKSYDTDYKRAWKECNHGCWMGQYLLWIGLVTSKPSGTPEGIRKRFPWSKVEAQIFRFVRKSRGLPLRDAKAAS